MKKKQGKCRCRPPKSHEDCSYCGSGYEPDYICGMCAAAGIDGKVIRGTGRVICKVHRKEK